MRVRVIASLAMVVVFASANALAQMTTNAPPVPTEEPDDEAWSLTASAYTYFVPDSANYVQPTFTADRGRLHLEARYNYEAIQAGSAWVGYNFSGGETLAWTFTRC